jgi:hypothetical protein
MLIDTVLISLFALVALGIPALAWHCVVNLLDGGNWRKFPAKPARLSTRIVAAAVSIYIALVCLVAVSELPRAFYRIVGSENSN